MDVSSLDQLADSLDNAAVLLVPTLDEAMNAAMADLVTYIQDDELSGQVLNVRSGRLRRSVQSDVADGNDSISGAVSANTPYAAIHEYGGVIQRALRLQPSRRLRQPRTGRIVEPERSYLRQALADKADEIGAALTLAVMEALP